MFVVGKMPSTCQLNFKFYKNKDIFAVKWHIGCSALWDVV